MIVQVGFTELLDEFIVVGAVVKVTEGDVTTPGPAVDLISCRTVTTMDGFILGTFFGGVGATTGGWIGAGGGGGGTGLTSTAEGGAGTIATGVGTAVTVVAGTTALAALLLAATGRVGRAEVEASAVLRIVGVIDGVVEVVLLPPLAEPGLPVTPEERRLSLRGFLTRLGKP